MKRVRFARLWLQGLLMFQLAVGMQWPIAHAAITDSLPPRAERCAQHAALGSGGPLASPNATPPRSLAHNVFHKSHDCCRSAACQCHFAYIPAIDGARPLPMAPATQFLPNPRAGFVAARPDEFFKPPIP